MFRYFTRPAICRQYHQFFISMDLFMILVGIMLIMMKNINGISTIKRDLDLFIKRHIN